MNKLLFVCTGNYYRSRFAEMYFNALAERASLNWRVASRGLATEWGAGNLGPLSAEALHELARQGIAAEPPRRFPLQLQAEELKRADLIIALNESEHRPMLQTRFPGWAERAQYWHILDLGVVPASVALPEIEREVQALIQRLSAAAIQ